MLVQLAIGAVYAWNTFSKALVAPESAMQLTKVVAAIPFEVAIGMIFVGAFIGGKIQDRRGPQTVALVGVVIYAIGIILSSFARERSDLGCSSSATACSAASVSAWPISSRSPCCRSGFPTRPA